MKPIKTKTFLIQNLLIAVSVMLAVIGFILSAKTIPFFPSIQAITTGNQTQIEVTQGIMPFAHLTLFLAFIFVYLMFEFYGFKPAFYTSVNISIMMFFTYMICHLIKNLALNPGTSQTDMLISQLIVYKPQTILSLSGATLSGYTLALILATAIKKMTHNYFMFIRFPISAFLGFAVFTGVYIFVTEINLSSYETMLWNGITPLSHFLALSLVAVIPLYILRLFLGLFRGWQKDDESQVNSKKGLFKGAEIKNETFEVPVENTQIEPAPETTNEKEITVSKKVKLEPTGT